MAQTIFGPSTPVYFTEGCRSFALTLSLPDARLFGHPVGELGLTTELPRNAVSYSLEQLPGYLSKENIRTCTYRAVEEIHSIRSLEELGFRFVQTLNWVECSNSHFRPLPAVTGLKVGLASNSDHSGIVAIEREVFDYSTFQIDPDIPSSLARSRNALKINTYLTDPDLLAYTIRVGARLAGFLLFSTNRQEGRAVAEAGAVLPEFHGMLIGAALYSNAFRSVFDSGIARIGAGYSAQNHPVGQLYSACGFTLVKQETHLRYFCQKTNFEGE